MHFNTAATAVALFAAATSAIPFPFPQNAGSASGSNMCDASTFNAGSQYDIPQATTGDCTTLINNIDRTQTWSIAHSWARLETQGTCAFTVRVIAGTRNGLVGGADMYDLIRDSMNKFPQDGQIAATGQYVQIVSAQGEVDCNASGGGSQVRVEWILSYSGYNPPN